MLGCVWVHFCEHPSLVVVLVVMVVVAVDVLIMGVARTGV